MKAVYRWSALSSILILGLLNFTSAGIIHNHSVTTYYDTEGNAFPVGSITVVNNRDSSDTITLLDRNLGATEYYNQNLSNPNAGSYGYYFQWGNNYGFSAQSYAVSTPINASAYSWSNPYYSSTFRSDGQGTVGGWDSSKNANLWGGGGDPASGNGGRDTTADGYQRQGPCPAGWHVPSLGEWNRLIEIISVQDTTSHDWVWTPATKVIPGYQLKNRLDILRTLNNQLLISPSGIIVGQNGTLVRGIPEAGTWNGIDWGYPNGRDSTNFWTSSPLNSSQNSSAYFWYGYQENVWQIGVDTAEHSRSHAFPMRCFKNLDDTELELTFNTMGGTSMNGQSVPLNGTTHIPGYDPKKTGYTFAGWYADQALTTPWQFGVTTISQDTTIYAKWTPIPYTVTFNSMGGSSVPSQTVNYDSLVVEPTVPTKVGYTFAGWYADQTLTTPWDFTSDVITGDTILYAKWDEVTYVVSRYNYDGTLIYSGSYAEGTVPNYTGATPTKPSTVSTVYTHDGWTPVITAVMADASYTATFSESVREYTITWLDDQGDLIDTTKVAYGTTPTHFEPTKTGNAQYSYTFAGWSPAISSVEGDVTYTAQFTPTLRTYTVTWENEDGTELEVDRDVVYGTTPTYDGVTPAKADTVQYSYTFAGWSPAISSVEGNATYTATYTETTRDYLITFKDENGTVLQTGMVAYGTSPTYTGATPTKAGNAQYSYTFGGWNPAIHNVNGTQVYTATYNQSVNSYTITWLNDDDSLINTTTGDYGTMPSHSNPAKIGNAQYSYTFAGWTPALALITGPATYKATYIQTTNNYTVTVNVTPNGYGTVTTGNGSATSTSITVPYGTAISTGGTNLTIGGTILTAVPSEQTSQYTYAFSGRTSTCGNTLTENCSIDAVFTRDIRNYIISFVDYDGTELQSSTMQYGGNPNYHMHPNPPVRASTQTTEYTFAGWNPEIHSVDGVQVYTATYAESPKTYNITWNYKDSSGTDTGDITQVNYNVLPTHTNPVTYTLAHKVYTFAGWTPTVAVVTGDIAYTAQYTIGCETGYIDVSGNCVINNYEITWIYRNELGELTTTGSNFAYGENPLEPVLPTTSQSVATGYTFVGWTPTVAVVTGEITYTAQYTETPRSYTVSFNSDGGTPTPSNQNILYGDTATKPENPTKMGYNFGDWYFNGSTFNFSTAITGNITLDANWDLIHYTITYKDGENVLSGLTPTTYTIEDSIILPTASKTNYVFSGWLESDNYISNISLGTYGNKVLQAEWKADTNNNGIPDEEETAIKVTVNYVYTGGRGEASPSVSGEYLPGISYSFTSPTVPYYTADIAEVSGVATVTTGITVTYSPVKDDNNNNIADEEESHFTVEFSGGSEGGTLSGQKIWNDVLTGLTLGQANIEIPEPVADSGYVFGGWEPKTPELTDVVSTGVVYSVVWKVDANGNGVPDEEETATSSGGRSGVGRRNHASEDAKIDSDPDGLQGSNYSQELRDAYEFAYKNEITTQASIDNADMEGNLTRIAMAKMLSKFCINVLGMDPDESRVNKFSDISDELDEQYDNGVTLAYQLGVMGLYMPNNNFRPHDLVTRGEFATALSRILWGDKYNVLDTNNMPFYEKHINALKESGIMNQVNPFMNEIRGYVMLMLMRTVSEN